VARDINPFETANAGFAQALYEDFLQDPKSVSPEWRSLFEAGVVGEQPPAVASPNRPAAALDTPPAISPGTEVKGPAARLVANMEESLRVPTATTFRQFPVAILESRRAGINRALAAAGRSEKVSFTHLIGYAIVRAAIGHAAMGQSYKVVDGTGYRLTPGARRARSGGGRRAEGRVPRPGRAGTPAGRHHGFRHLPRDLRVAGRESPGP